MILHGIGRRIRISKTGSGCIWEGQFKNGMVNGPARFIRVYNDGSYCCDFSYWQDDNVKKEWKCTRKWIG